jgi:transcriptional regulator with XRE-family HTH domain
MSTSTTSDQLDPKSYEDDQTAGPSPTIRELTDAYASLRGRVLLVNTDIEQGHRKVRGWALDERTRIKARRSAPDLLEELATDRGLAWSAIARLAGVSVSAVRKWRTGEAPSPERRFLLARLAAFLDLVEEMPVADPAAWLSMPFVAGFTITGEDLFRAGRLDVLLDHAAGHLEIKDLLASFDPEWRAHYASDWEIVDAPDGNRSIRRRDQDR